MKLTAIALGLGLIGMSASATAAPYYVGENLDPDNNITLEYLDTPTKTNTDAGRADRGNIANFELKGDYNVWRELSVGANLPFFFASSGALGTGTDAKASVGNIAINGMWSDTLSATTDDFEWGYALALDVFLPSSRSDEAGTVAGANPTIDLFRYSSRWTTMNPTAGLFIEGDRFLAKTNVGLGYSFIQRKNQAPTDRNRFNTTWQLGASFKAYEWLAFNAEYNSIFHDRATAPVGTSRFRQAIAPSVSATWNQVRGNVLANIPLDKTTRDVHNVAFALGVGYTF